jgi:ubiquinone biosynthesis protein UbiJ
MGRTERRLLKVLDELERLREERRMAVGELDMLRHIDDDAQRDAAGGIAIDRDDARITGQDVDRFEREVARLSSRIEDLEEKRSRLAGELD